MHQPIGELAVTDEESIRWISVKQRVPDDRRKVLAWGIATVPIIGARSAFLGVTQFNPSKTGGKFDVDSFGMFGHMTTHWAEIKGPPAEAAFEHAINSVEHDMLQHGGKP
jgi:hypothetical protein